MEAKIKVQFAGGSRRVLKSPSEFPNVNKDRRVRVVMSDFKVYEGNTNGWIDDDGDFYMYGIRNTIALPFKKMLGWCYVSSKRSKKNE